MGKSGARNLPFENKTEYTEFTPTNTPDLQAIRDMGDKPESLDPAIQATFDRARQTSANRLNSAYNQNIPTDARLAMRESADRNFLADEGAAKASNAYNSYDTNLRRRLALAEMTTGKPLQSRSSGFNSQFDKGFLRDLLTSAASGAGTAAAAFA